MIHLLQIFYTKNFFSLVSFFVFSLLWLFIIIKDSLFTFCSLIIKIHDFSVYILLRNMQKN